MWFIASWVIFALALAWPAWLAVRRLARRRLWRVRCEACRYDLRGTPSRRCPECGHDVTKPARFVCWRPVLLHVLIMIALLTASHLVNRIEAIQQRGWIAAVPTTVLIACVSPEKPAASAFESGSPLLDELNYRTDLIAMGIVPSLRTPGDESARWQEAWLVHKALRLRFGPALEAPAWQIPAVAILQGAYAKGLLSREQRERLERAWYVHVETRTEWPLGATVTGGIHPQMIIYGEGYRLTAHARTPGYRDHVEARRIIDSPFSLSPPVPVLGVAEQSGPVEYEFVLERYHYPANTWEEIGRQTQVVTTVSQSRDHGLAARELPADLIATLSPQLNSMSSRKPEVEFDVGADPEFRKALGSTTFAITITLYRDGEQVGTGSGVWVPPDEPSGKWDSVQRMYIPGRAALPWEVPIELETTQAKPGGHLWTLVIEGDPNVALRDFDATSYWAGTYEFKNISVDRVESGK